MSYSEKEKAIFEKYPKLFKRVSLPMQQTCMCWGLEIPDEWFDDIDTLCENIYNVNPDAIEFEQIKTKFGGIRIYYDFISDVNNEESSKISRLIDEAEEKLQDEKYRY
jgi:hypothetical protein